MSTLQKAQESAGRATAAQVTAVLSYLGKMMVDDTVWDLIASISYQGMDPETIVRALIIAFKTKGDDTAYAAALADRNYDITLTGADSERFWIDMLTVGAFAAKLGNQKKKINKIPTAVRTAVDTLFKDYRIQDANNQVPAPGVITLQRILAVFPFLVGVYINKGLMKPVTVVAGLPNEFAHPQGWGLMNATQRVSFKVEYEKWMVQFYKIINRKKLGATTKTDDEILAEQWTYTSLQVNDYEKNHRNEWAAAYAAMTKDNLVKV